MSYGYKCATCSRKDTEICEQCLGDQYAPIAKPAPVQSAEELQKLSTALTYILSSLAKNVWMGTRGEKECIRAEEEFEEDAVGHIKRYFDEIAAAQRQAGREEALVEMADNWLLGYKAGKERGRRDDHIQFIKTQRKEPPHAAD